MSTKKDNAKNKPSKKKRALSLRESLKRWLRVWKTFAPFVRPHRRALLWGMLPALGVVLCHLALPWPIKTMLDDLFKHKSAHSSWSTTELGLAYFALIVALGVAEYLQRLWVARFAIAWVRDIRADAFIAASRVDPRRFSITTGDLVARLVGDTARLKAGLKGFLTHWTTNSMLFFGMSVVLFQVSWHLGLVFFVVGWVVISITLWGTWRLYNRYRQLRRKEGKLATRIENALGEGSSAAQFARVNRSSGIHEASVVQIQQQVTLSVQIILGGATLFSLWLGMHLVETKAIEPGDLVLVTLYALKMVRPGVRLSRQGTRIGKMLALGDRLERLLREGSREAKDIPPLQKEIRLQKIVLADKGKVQRHPRLQNVSLTISAGQRIAVLGGAGSGKSSLLSILAAQVAPTEGELKWDGENYKKLSFLGLCQRIAYQSESPFWLKKPLREVLCAEEEDLAKLDDILAICGMTGFVERLPDGLDTLLGADELSAHQAQALALVAALMAEERDLVLLDEPFTSLNLVQANQVLSVLAQSRWRTIVIAMTRPMNLSWFDRVIALEAGQVVFDGPPRSWQIASEGKA